MDNHASHSYIHAAKKNTAQKVIIHRNERNILAILFDEINCSTEKFDKVKKEIHAKHIFHVFVYKEPVNDIFNRFT